MGEKILEITEVNTSINEKLTKKKKINSK